MTEASKAKRRYLAEGTFNKYFKGRILDVGCGGDKITPDATGWDLGDGDATYLATIPDESFQTVFSSHCLEHLAQPLVAIKNWWRVLKTGGHMIILVPDEDLYERGVWPSRFNPDHKFSYTIWKDQSWCPRSINLIHLLTEELPFGNILSIKNVDTNYNYNIRHTDQSLKPDVEVAIEAIIKKLPPLNVD